MFPQQNCNSPLKYFLLLFQFCIIHIWYLVFSSTKLSWQGKFAVELSNLAHQPKLRAFYFHHPRLNRRLLSARCLPKPKCFFIINILMWKLLWLISDNNSLLQELFFVFLNFGCWPIIGVWWLVVLLKSFLKSQKKKAQLIQGNMLFEKFRSCYTLQ